MVDLGVCYYNLGQTIDAQQLFQKALSIDPHQPIALFNMGIVNERQGSTKEALEYYHRALDAAPTEELRSSIMAAVQRMSGKAGAAPPAGSPQIGGAPAGK
jgi:Tfp pilus assembly protein PilF